MKTKYFYLSIFCLVLILPFQLIFTMLPRFLSLLGFVLAFIEMPSNLRHESVKLEQSQGFIYAHGLMMFIFAYIYNPILPVYFNAKAPWVVVNAISAWMFWRINKDYVAFKDD